MPLLIKELDSLMLDQGGSSSNQCMWWLLSGGANYNWVSKKFKILNFSTCVVMTLYSNSKTVFLYDLYLAFCACWVYIPYLLYSVECQFNCILLSLMMCNTITASSLFCFSITGIQEPYHKELLLSRRWVVHCTSCTIVLACVFILNNYNCHCILFISYCIITIQV